MTLYELLDVIQLCLESQTGLLIPYMELVISLFKRLIQQVQQHLAYANNGNAKT